MPETLIVTHPTQSLDASGSSFGAGYTLHWIRTGDHTDGNENTLHPNVDKAGNYVLTIVNLQTGCINSATVTVIGNTDAPTGAIISTRDPSCFGDQDAFIHVDQVNGGVPPYQYSLNNGPLSSNNAFDKLSSGDYSIAIEDVNGCRWDSLITITDPPLITIDLGPDIEIEFGEEAVIQATINLTAPQMDTLIWSPDEIIECFDLACKEVTVHTFNTVILSATVVALSGCRVSDEMTINVDKVRKLYISTVFSPNGDGINDVFYISGNEHQIVRIKKFLIFNRWGNLVFEIADVLPNDPSKGWNGTYKNEKLNPDVFVCLAEIEYIDGVVEQYTGDVTLMK